MIWTHYILDEEGNPVRAMNLFDWYRWYENACRQVAEDNFGHVRVSTVFLGLNHNWREDGPPILWETIVFGGELDEQTDRCAGSREQAEAMHTRMVERVKNSLQGSTEQKSTL